MKGFAAEELLDYLALELNAVGCGGGPWVFLRIPPSPVNPSTRKCPLQGAHSTRRDVASRRSAPSGHVATTTTTQKWGSLFKWPKGPFSACHSHALKVRHVPWQARHGVDLFDLSDSNSGQRPPGLKKGVAERLPISAIELVETAAVERPPAGRGRSLPDPACKKLSRPAPGRKINGRRHACPGHERRGARLRSRSSPRGRQTRRGGRLPPPAPTGPWTVGSGRSMAV